MVSEEPHFSDVHKIAEVYRQLRANQDPEALTTEALRILGTTEPECEFMAIATWSQRCNLIHRLYPDKYPLAADDKYKIPDLFAVFQHEGKDVPVLIEVKSTYSPIQVGESMKTERISKSYRDKLLNYSQLIGIPVLVANQIRPGGFWFMVDVRTIGIDDDWHVQTQNDLMGTLVGTRSISFRSFLRFIMKLEKDETKEKDGETVEVKGVVRECHFETRDGEKIENTPLSLMYLFGLADPQEKQSEDERFFTLSWEIGERMAFIDYQVLRSAILIDEELRDEPCPWSKMLHNGRFPFEYSTLETIINRPDIFEFHIQTRPKVMPDFLK